MIEFHNSRMLFSFLELAMCPVAVLVALVPQPKSEFKSELKNRIILSAREDNPIFKISSSSF